MKTFKTTKCLGIALLILSFVILLASCTSGAATNTVETTTTAPPTTTTSPTTTIPPTTTTAPPTTTIPPTTITTPPTTTAPPAATPIIPKGKNNPVVGAEFPDSSKEQEKWIITQFDYDSIQDSKFDWYFPWSLTIRNKTETELELTAYIAYIGYHLWIGHVTETPFVLKGGETKIITGGDILSEAFVDQIAYIREIIIDVHIAER